MLTVGVDPNWQQDKLARLMQALELARARRDRKKEEQEQRATTQFKLIMSAAERNPGALKTSTVRDFVSKNAAIIPGLQEWYELETQTLDAEAKAKADPNRPENAYDNLMRTADGYAAATEVSADAPGPFGAVGQAMQGAIRANPQMAFDAASRDLTPSQMVGARQHASKIGADIPLTDPGEANKKISGSMYVVQNPHLFSEDVVHAARISLQIEDPKTNPDEKLSGSLYVLEHPDQFNGDTVNAAKYQLNITQPPWEVKKPEDKLSGAFAVLNNQAAYSPDAVRYAKALVAQTERGPDEPTGGREEPSSKGRLTEYQAGNEVDDFSRDIYERFDGAKPRRLTPTQRRKASSLLMSGGDSDSFIVNSLFPADGASLDKIIGFHLNQPGAKNILKARGEDPKARAKKLRDAAVAEINRLTRSGMTAGAARAKVFLDLLEGAQ